MEELVYFMFWFMFPFLFLLMAPPEVEVDISYQWMISHDSTTESGINSSAGLNFLFVQIKQHNFMSTRGTIALLAAAMAH